MENLENKEEIRSNSKERIKAPDVQGAESRASMAAQITEDNDRKKKNDSADADALLENLMGVEELENEKVEAAVEQAKDIKPYDENGRVNGGEWAKAIQIIHNNISWWSFEELELREEAFEKILGKGQVFRVDTLRDGGSTEWYLKNGTRVFLDNSISSSEVGYITVYNPNGTEEKFNTDGVKVE